MRAFLEKINNEWLDDFVYMSKYRFIDRGIDVIPFDGDNLSTLFKHNPKIGDVCIGSVEATTKFFEYIEIKTPEYLGYPESLRKWLKRNITEITFGETEGMSYPYFIKPSKGVKQFTGSLVENNNQRNILKTYYNVSDDTQLYLSDCIDFKSEFRCFVHNGKLEGIHWYAGDFKLFPNVDDVEQMIKDFTNPPISYTLDVGVTKFGTALIEVNDFWAIGSYGFDAKKYVKMSIDRFLEIYKNNKI